MTIKLAFEVWRSEAEHSIECSMPNQHNDALRKTISPDAALVHVIYGSSTDDVMGKYHTWNGWDAWKSIEGVTDQPYTAEHLREQMTLRPKYYEARS